jgi:hypothetical protein
LGVIVSSAEIGWKMDMSKDGYNSVICCTGTGLGGGVPESENDQNASEYRAYSMIS